ncbi:MAG: hypothetical protein HY883_04070 [Deltaproteobacteria bacterium]|nr:hypothetical protein [Deltaproteobacteria bacterium]
MIEAYHKERLALFDLLTKEGEGVGGGRYWTLEPSKVRFRYGETLAELKIPYHLGAEDETIIEGAVFSLALLLKRRFEEYVKEGAGDVPAGIDTAIARPLKEKTFKTDILLAGSMERDIAREALLTAPFIDGAILANWLGPEGHGRNFARWASDLMEKALKDEAASAIGERTSYIALLSVVNSVRKKKEGLKRFRIRGLSYEKLDMVGGSLLYTTLRRSLWALFERLKKSAAQYYNPAAEVLIKSTLTPSSFLSIPSNLLSTSLNPYAVGRELFDAVSPYMPAMTEVTVGSGELLSVLEDKVRGRKEIMEAVKLQHDISEFRRLIMGYLMDFDVAGLGGHRLLYDVYQEDLFIRSLFGDEKMIEKLRGALDGIKENFSKDAKRVEALEAIEGFLSAFCRKPGWFKKKKEEAALVFRGVFDGFFSCWFDLEVERFTSPMRLHLVDRRLGYDSGMLLSEYRRGRLYRFSTDARPILSPLEVEQEGQLFIDMKDFSRRTLKVKEIAMAEFMKENFYDPILDAAGRYASGTGLLEREGGVRLNSLPGDAAVFSGSVGRLISLARDIQRIIRRSREALLRRLPPVKDELLLECINKRFMEKREDFSRKRKGLEDELKRGDEKARAAVVTLAEEEQRLENVCRDELEAAITRELEAGLFISSGTKAEVILIEGREGVSSPTRVAIGEKINEASRGTFRNTRIKARLEMLLAKERLRRNNTRLRYPFDVYIDKNFIIRVPYEFDNAISALVAQEDREGAKAMAAWIARECYRDFQRLSKGEPFSSLRIVESHTDIYNKGQAMSEEALKAYMGEAKGTKFFFHKEVGLSVLDKYIQENFFLPSEKLDFWFAHETKGETYSVEAFVRSGEVTFKGFEAAQPTVVWEMVNGEGEFFKALDTYHLKGWLEEAKKKKG